MESYVGGAPVVQIEVHCCMFEFPRPNVPITPIPKRESNKYRGEEDALRASGIYGHDSRGCQLSWAERSTDRLLQVWVPARHDIEGPRYTWTQPAITKGVSVAPQYTYQSRGDGHEVGSSGQAITPVFESYHVPP